MAIEVGAPDPPPARDFHWRAVLDVFEAFLATENPQVIERILSSKKERLYIGYSGTVANG